MSARQLLLALVRAKWAAWTQRMSHDRLCVTSFLSGAGVAQRQQVRAGSLGAPAKMHHSEEGCVAPMTIDPRDAIANPYLLSWALYVPLPKGTVVLDALDAEAKLLLANLEVGEWWEGDVEQSQLRNTVHTNEQLVPSILQAREEVVGGVPPKGPPALRQHDLLRAFCVVVQVLVSKCSYSVSRIQGKMHALA